MESTDLKNKREQTIQAKPRINQKMVAVFILVCILASGFSIISFGMKHSTATLPPNVTSSLSYPIYYSPGNSNGYAYQVGSEKIKAGILFYTMVNGSKRIFITEQATPTNTINLNSLPKHTPLDVPIGKAVLGTGLGNPSIVITTPSTLIQLTSSKGVTKADIVSVAQSLVLQN